MSKFSDVGLSIGVFSPLLAGRQFIGELRDHITDYTHTLAALGGYISAQITIAGGVDALEEWISLGLGRHIEVYDDAHQVIFEGFVNSVQYGAGGLTLTRGPLTQLGNRVSVEYTPLDTGAKAKGSKTLTAVANDTRSQSLYGIWPQVVNGGEITPTQALQLRDTWLQENRYPQTSQTLDISGGGDTSLILGVLGYGAWAEHYDYSSATAGAVNLSAKITAVLAAQVNAIFSTDYSRVTANTLQVPAATDANSTQDAWSVIRELVALGDANDTRYLFGWYAGRRAVYAPVPSTVEYQYRRTQRQGEVQTMTGGLIRPWNVLPGKWLFYADLLIGRSQNGLSIRDDPRNMFIESLTYSAPYNLSFTGGKVSTVEQRLARLGMKGV